MENLMRKGALEKSTPIGTDDWLATEFLVFA